MFKCQTQTIINDEKLRNNLEYYSELSDSCGLSVKHVCQLSSPEAKSYRLREAYMKVGFSETLVRLFAVQRRYAVR